MGISFVSSQTGLDPFSVAIVGAGPAGLYAASLCGSLGLRVAVFEALPFVGGQCAALYPCKGLKGVPGFPGAPAQDLIKHLERQARKSRAAIFLESGVEDLSQAVDEMGQTMFTLLAQGRIFQARSVLVATGMGRFCPNKPVLEAGELDTLGALEGKSVHYLVSDPKLFQNRCVVIAGGGDSAVDWAFELLPIAKSVTLVHRRETFRCAPESASRLKEAEDERRLLVYRSSQIKTLKSSNGQLTHVVLQTKTEDRVLQADHLLVFFGLTMDPGTLSSWSLASRLITRTKISIDPLTCSTSVPGVFAIGDIATRPSSVPPRVNLIASGFGEAVAAAYAIRQYLHPDQQTALNVQSLCKESGFPVV